jgi:hypothetical protein
MANVYKCDLCGKIADPRDDDVDVGNAYVEIVYYKNRHRHSILKKKFCVLCVDCLVALQGAILERKLARDGSEIKVRED